MTAVEWVEELIDKYVDVLEWIDPDELAEQQIVEEMLDDLRAMKRGLDG